MVFLNGRDAQGQALQEPSVGGEIGVSGCSFLGTAAASGTQTYTCKQAEDGSGPKWVHDGPYATLTDPYGSGGVGTHYGSPGGPMWESSIDGSSVQAKAVGKEVRSNDDVPWLKLEAISTSGESFGRVQFIQRVDTSGGVAPATADESTLGQQVMVNYTANYHFWGRLSESDETHS